MGLGRRLRPRFCSLLAHLILLPARLWPWMVGWVCSGPGTRRAGLRDWLRFGGCGIDDRGDLGNSICGEAALGGMFADQRLVGCNVDAVDFVLGHVAVNPLNFGTEFAQDAAGGLRDGLQLLWGEFSC